MLSRIHALVAAEPQDPVIHPKTCLAAPVTATRETIKLRPMHASPRSLLRKGLLTAALGGCLLSACGGQSRSSQPPPQGPPYSQPYPAPSGQPGVPQPVSPAPGVPDASPQGPVLGDPLSTLDLAFLRQRAQAVLNELVLALPAAKQQRVAGIPLVLDDTVGEVNAFAACSASGQSAMAITDGLLQIQAILASAQAHDEAYRTQKVDEYIRIAASGLQPGRPIPLPPAGFFPGATDPNIVRRQHQVFDEQLAFVLGHELGHHHLGHLPCTARPDPLGAGEAARILSHQVPLFNQPNEIGSDLAGVNNVLDAGRYRAARGEYYWTEGGGLLTMRFFAGFGSFNAGTLLTAFERSHPPPQLRTPIIQQAANTWRSTGGAPLLIPGF